MRRKNIKRFLFLTGWLAAAATMAEAQIVKNEENRQTILPDLAFGKVEKRSQNLIEVLIVNQGKEKSAPTEGSYNCKSNGDIFTLDTNALLTIKELAAGESFKVILKCRKGWRVTGAILDVKNKVRESNENNNSIKF